MEKYKIAFTANATIVGGVEEALVQLLRNIDYSKCSVTLFGEINDYYRSRIPSDVNIISIQTSVKNTLKNLFKNKHYYDCMCYLFNSLSCKLLHCLNKKDYQAYLSMRGYRNMASLSEQSYDLVVAFTYLVSSIVGNAAYRLNAAQRVLWVHGESGHTAVTKKLDKYVYDRFDTVFCCSQAISDRFKQIYPISGKKTKVFYNIADVERIIDCSKELPPFTLKHPSIVTVGRLSEEKGQQMIPKIIRLLLDEGYNIHWYLVGDGPLRSTIEREVQDNKVLEHITFMGAQSNPYPYIKNADIYVQPSFTEGYCTTTVEAKILCKPIITTDVPGMREQIIPYQTGIITEDFTPESLFVGIKYLLDTPDASLMFSSNLKNEAHSQVSELEKLYALLEK